MKKSLWKYLNSVNKKNHYLSNKKWKIKRWEEIIFRMMFILLTISAWVVVGILAIALCYLLSFSTSCDGHCSSMTNNNVKLEKCEFNSKGE